MLKSMNFLSGKSRGKVRGGSGFSSLAPVILGLVPRILLQRVSNLVNKLALLLHKCRLKEDSWDKPKNDGCWERGFSLVSSKQRSVAVGNKVMDTRLPQPAGCGDKYDVSGLDSRLLRCARNDAVSNNIAFKGLDVVRQYAALLERRVQTGTRARKALVVTRQANPQGRSMIEMLGVLAIIAVLSVGGIAGYSKAMEKFKVNKLISEYNMLIFGLMEHKASILLPDDDSIDFELGETVKALNLVPENWRLLNEQYLDDGRGNLVNARIGMSSVAPVLVIDFNLGGLSEDESGSLISTTFSNKLCFEMFNTLVYPLRDGLVMGRVFRTGNKEDNRYYSAAYCGGGNKCLQDLNLSDIKRECDACDGKHRCNVTITF